jgi:hypothetical protein
VSEGVATTIGQLCAERDGWRCVRCGRDVSGSIASCHHRKLAGAGGPDTSQNRITLCGSGSSGCHGWVHNHPLLSYDEHAGWMISRYADNLLIATMPVMCARRGLITLDESYGWALAA